MLSSSGATFFIPSTWSVVVSDKWLLCCQDLKLPAAVVTYDVMQDADYVPRHHRHSAQLSVLRHCRSARICPTVEDGRWMGGDGGH